jgi:hypothetical protein
MRKNFLIVFALALLLPCAMVMAQTNPKDGYGGWVGENQTRNIPAGTVQDPGSHLTYIIDAGVNARAKFGPAIDTDDVTGNVLADLGIGKADGTLDESKVYQSFISITNTHPTQAVTVHFRYFNDNCEDLLDFLVVLTCNDTLIFDPFNFEIPASGGENTRDRIFGPLRTGKVLEPIQTQQFGSGRFIITAAASVANTDLDDDPEILFPYEMRDKTGQCNIQQGVTGSSGTLTATTLEQLLTGYYAGTDTKTRYANVGTTPGLSDTNLHVFNATQESFNYLIGHLTTAKPATPGTDQVSWGLTAWVRPVVNGNLDLDPMPITGFPDGDATQNGALTGKLVLGSESWINSSGVKTAVTNNFYLRNEVHGGDVAHIGGSNGGNSLYGALGTLALHPVPDQVIHLISVQDDYNGSNNAGVTGFRDRSSNISPAFTTYVLQIYDNKEKILTLPQENPLNVSPPRPGAVLDLEVVCFCLRTFLTTTIAVETSVDDLSIQDLDDFFDVLSPKGAFAGLLVPATPDQSGGWIRFVRDNTTSPAATDGVVEFDKDVNAAIGGPFVNGAMGSGAGTATVFNLDGKLSDSAGEPSFLTEGLHVLVFEGFGVSFYLQAVASDARISEQGVEYIFGLTPPMPGL